MFGPTIATAIQARSVAHFGFFFMGRTIPRMRRQVGDTAEEVKGEALAPDAQDNALGFLVPGDRLPFVFANWNNFRWF